MGVLNVRWVAPCPACVHRVRRSPPAADRPTRRRCSVVGAISSPPISPPLPSRTADVLDAGRVLFRPKLLYRDPAV